MANGQDIAKANAARFDAWVAERYRANDWLSYLRDRKLNPTEIARGCGFAKSVLGQNPKVKQALETVEQDLENRSILRPSRTETAVTRA